MQIVINSFNTVFNIKNRFIFNISRKYVSYFKIPK